MTSHSGRLARLEMLRPSKPRTAVERAQWVTFWDERLALITDQQLDQMETLMIKMGVESGDPKDEEERDIRDMVHVLDDGERAELRAIFSAMGLVEEDW